MQCYTSLPTHREAALDGPLWTVPLSCRSQSSSELASVGGLPDSELALGPSGDKAKRHDEPPRAATTNEHRLLPYATELGSAPCDLRLRRCGLHFAATSWVENAAATTSDPAGHIQRGLYGLGMVKNRRSTHTPCSSLQTPDPARISAPLLPPWYIDHVRWEKGGQTQCPPRQRPTPHPSGPPGIWW